MVFKQIWESMLNKEVFQASHNLGKNLKSIKISLRRGKIIQIVKTLKQTFMTYQRAFELYTQINQRVS